MCILIGEHKSPNDTAVNMNPILPLEPAPGMPSLSPSSDGQGERQASTPLASVRAAAKKDSPKERVSVSSTCVGCRSKHLKCDGLVPCTRCVSNSLECVHVRSRRGFKGPRRNGVTLKASAGLASPTIIASSTCSDTPPSHEYPLVRVSLNSPNDQILQSSHTSPRLALTDTPKPLVTFDSKLASSNLDLRERCIEAFYFHFYPAHPFVLPRSRFMALRKQKPLQHLEAVMRYIGSFYVAQEPTPALGLEAERSVYNMSRPKDGFKVQAMLILAIGLDGYTFQEKALQILVEAQDLALELGMNRREFAMLNGDGSDVLEESWRRTWWELFVVDGMIAGVHQRSSFRLNEVAADVGLPCEEEEYVNGHIPPPHSIQEFDDELFGGGDSIHSSFTYRIAGIRNMGRVLALSQIMQYDEHSISRVDAHLVNWKLHLPNSKKKFINSSGQLDEMIFQAHMISAATTILLHREHSQLDSSVAKNITSCAPHKEIDPGESYNVHAAKTIQAAQDISNLITLPVTLTKHTHFFTCVVSLASIVHLSCWSVLMPLIDDGDLKQQLRLSTGALKSLWQVWPSAGRAFGQVKGVAREIYAAKKQAAEVGYWSNYTQDEIMRSMIADQAIMEDLQLL